MSEQLLPCPFCGGTNTEIRENGVWTGLRNKIHSVEINHWCDDQQIANHITRKARTKEEAIQFWNKRA